MLFFKDLLDTKFEDKSFRDIFKKECHICNITVKLVARLEEDYKTLPKILAGNSILQKDYKVLKEGDICHPKMVLKLYDGLGMDSSDLKSNCPKLKKS